MSVRLSPPAQLGFPRPLTQIVKRSLIIENNNREPVAFKVKTTAPKQYCVRPNQGRVEPGEKVEVQIVLQPLAEDPPPHAKCKDKFLVQSAFIPANADLGSPSHSLQELWHEIERNNKAAIEEQKIRCAYLAPEDGTGNPNGIPEENEDQSSPVEHSRLDESGIYSAAQASPAGKYAGDHLNGDKNLPSIPASNHNTGLAAGAGALGGAGVGAGIFSAVNHQNSNATGTPTAAGAPVTAQAGSRELPSLSAAEVQGAGAPTNAALEQSLSATTTDKQKLDVALAEIERLRSQLNDASGPNVTGLRKRGGAGAADASGANTQVASKAAAGQQTASGVPIEVVAGLVFAVFVLTYLFF